METIQSYKCPCCGAALAYDGNSDSLHCSSCGNDFSVENLRRLSEAESETSGGSVYNWEEYMPREFGEAEDIDLRAVPRSAVTAIWALVFVRIAATR